jgi:2-polyprenyl-3-methyl-5-hydroxy-6-metoxy-1,4-benzoquinol methylase
MIQLKQLVNRAQLRGQETFYGNSSMDSAFAVDVTRANSKLSPRDKGDPMTDRKEEQIESWSRNAEKWTAAVRGRTIASRREATDAAIIAAARSASPKKLLDIGCGEGWLCRQMADFAQEILGVDASPELIVRAREDKNASYLCLNYAEICAEPPCLGGGFDTVICNFSLLDDQAAPLLDALAKVSAPGARLLIQTLHPLATPLPYEDGWRVEQFEGFGDSGWAPMPVYMRRLSSWIDAISRSWTLRGLQEPRPPSTGLPASLLFIAERREIRRCVELQARL